MTDVLEFTPSELALTTIKSKETLKKMENEYVKGFLIIFQESQFKKR